MAKGKHKKAAARRRQQATEERIAELRTEIARETERVHGLEARAERLRNARGALEQLTARRDAAARDELDRLAELEDHYRQAVEREEHLARRIDDAFHDTMKLLIELEGGGLDGLEAVSRRMRLMSDATIVKPDHASGLTRERAVALQRAQGRRRTKAPELGDTRSGFETLTGVDGTDPRIQRLAYEAETARLSTGPFRDDRMTAMAWQLRSSVDMAESMSGEVLDSLGAVDTAEDAVEWCAERPADVAVTRELTEANIDHHSPALDRIPNPYVPLPLFARPADAIALRWWYRFSALGAAATASEVDAVAGRPLDLTAEEILDGVWPPSPGPWDALYRSCADMVASAVPFWLPPGQTSSYVGGEPLNSDDLAELRLGFGRCLVVLAEPLRIEPSGLSGSVTEILVSDADARSNATRARTLEDVSHRRVAPVALCDALSTWGAHIEAAVLEADAAGNRTDRVVWCVAIPTFAGDATIARVAIPARASQTVWAAELDALAAVAAWGAWATYDPTDAAVAVSALGERGSDFGSPSAVRVLSLSRGRSPSAGGGDGTRQVAPHVRRGHWRRQRHGPGGRLVKMVRIAPTVVGANRGPLTPQVYRLPLRQAGETAK